MQFAVCWSQVAGRRGPVDRKNCTANGLVRRGRPLTSQTAFGGQLPYKGSLVRPVARFHHSPFGYNGRLLRATSHEPRTTAFSTSRGSLEAACELRSAACGAVPKFDERTTTYDERNPCPAVRPYHFTKKSQKIFVLLSTYFYN